MDLPGGGHECALFIESFAYKHETAPGIYSRVPQPPGYHEQFAKWFAFNQTRDGQVIAVEHDASETASSPICLPFFVP